ncbi:MAG: hypothetical protein ABSD20_01150 [Terriglobales bacterium]|jgi:hypothetical protein
MKIFIAGIFRMVDGKIGEEWTEYSQLLLLTQLGLLPTRQQEGH